MLTGWRFFWRRYLGWFPVQFCMVCGSAYWGGLPRPGWRAWHMDYCSRKCADIDLDDLSPDSVPESPGMGTRLHVGLSIRGALRTGEYRNLTKSCTDKVTGRPLTEIEMFETLCDLLAAGHEMLPIGDECDNWDPKTGCKGHRIQMENSAS